MLIAYIMDGWMPLDDPNDKASKIKYCIYAFMYLLNTSKNSSRMKAPGKLLAGVGWGGGGMLTLPSAGSQKPRMVHGRCSKKYHNIDILYICSVNYLSTIFPCYNVLSTRQ